MDWSKLAHNVMSGIKTGLSNLTTAASTIVDAVKNAVATGYDVVAPAAAAAVVPAFGAVVTGAENIPQTFLTAFGEGGAAASAPIALGATATAALAAWSGAGLEAYYLYKQLQSEKVLGEALDKLNAALDKQRLALIGKYAPEVVTIVPPEVVTYVTPVEVTKAVPEVVTIVPPEVVTKAVPEVVTKLAPGLAPQVTVNVAPSSAPNVVVNVPPVPDPLGVTGPMTGIQLAALIPFLATSTATASHKQTQNCIPTTGAKLLEALLGALLPAAIAAGFMFSPQLQSAMTSVASSFVEAIYSPLTAQAPITPEKAPGIGAQLLSQAVLLGSGAHIMSIIAEASTPLKHMGIGYLAAFMADAAGFSRIAAAYQGMMIQVGLSQPMKYWAQAHFRPEIPSVGQLLRLAGEYAITREQFNQYMPYHGLSQEWIDRLWELADRPFSPMLFRFLANAGELPEDLLDRELKNASYNALSIPPLKKAFLRLAAGELQGQFAASVTGAYRKGLLTQGPFSDHLDNLGYSDRQKERAGYAAELDFAVNLAEEMRATFLQQHKMGQLSDGELGMQLSTLGYRGEKVSADVLKARAWFKPKPEPKVDPAIEKVFRDAQAKYIQGYLSLYRDGYIDEDELYADLISVQVPPEVAEATVFMESAKTLPKLAE
jgi:hypothetical protein